MHNNYKFSDLITRLQYLESKKKLASKKSSFLNTGFTGLLYCFIWFVYAPVNMYFFILLSVSMALVHFNKENNLNTDGYRLDSEIDSVKKEMDKLEASFTNVLHT